MLLIIVDLAYATKLLHEHVSALGNSSNVSQDTSLNTHNNEFKRDVYELTLIDPATMESFNIFVDKKTFDRAHQGTYIF